MKKLLIVLTFISGLLFSQQVMLSVSGQTIDEVNGGSLDIYMVNTDPVYGFQINIDDSGLLGDISGIQYGVASGGTAQDATFMVSTNASGLILGFSVTGSSIPAGEGILTTINWNGDTFPSVSGIITLSVTAISGIDGAALTYGIDTPFFIGAVDDCAGVPGGNAFIDDCGICSGGTTGLTPNADMDCTGLCFGDAQLFTYCFDEDDDGMGTPGTETNYCDALVDPGWIADCTDSVPDCFSNETDCAGICDGTAVYDCAEVCGGSAFQDMCGACDDTPDNDCEQDCLGIWGGTAIVDDCEMCVEPENFNQDMDCASICFGQSLEDCAGICDGSNYEDECGICNDNPNDDESDMDCAAICFGNALEDICGVCDDNPSNDGACVGCTDPNADNYEPDNTIEDGSCTYPTTGNVVINELQIWPLNPSFGEEFSEFIELLNISQFTLDLAGWTIASNSGSMAIQESYLLEPSSFIVLAISSNENLNLGIPVDYAWGFGSGLQLSNASDNIQIHDNAGSLIDEVQYDTGTWSINPGQSIELTHPLMNNNSLYNWVPGTIVYDSAGNLGTPGEYNTSLIQIPEIVLSQPEADFGVLWFGDSDSMEITITSTGGSDLTVLGFQFEDQSPMIGYDFPSIPFTLAIDETETFTVYFTPTELNMVYLDTLTILSNAPSNEQLTFPINGMGSLPEIQILNPTVTADSIYVNDSQIIVAELQNIGYYELELYDALMQNENSDFSVITPLPYVIVGQSTGLIEILFSPSTMGPIADTLYLSTTDPGQPQAQYGLMGYGLMANIQVYQTQLNFPTIHSDETMSAGITVANTGNGLLEISASTNSGNFVPESSNYAVYPDSTVWVQVNFTPTYVGGYSAQLYLNTNDPYQQIVTIELTASAISPTIVFVPLDASTVQGAIEMAEDGDTVLVAPGTYYESLNTLGKNITLLSETGAENTIIDAGAGVFGDGADGDLVVNAGETYYTDEVRSAVIGDNPLGQNTIQVEDASGFQVGDEVLIITMGHNEENEALNLTGQYETRRVVSKNGQILSLDNVLAKDFSVAYADTFQGVFNTSNNSYYTDWATNVTVGYEIVFYEKVKITKLKVFRNHENWSLWERNGTLIYQQEFSPSSQTVWREYDLESELIVEPGEYIISGFSSSSASYRDSWGGGGYYQSFRHGVVEFTRYVNGNDFPLNDYNWFKDRGNMIDFEYELVEPTLKHQVIKIHNFSNIENNGEITSHDWDGKTGGICFLRVADQLTNNGTISTSGKGFRGGDGSENYQYTAYGWRGEGIYGVMEGPVNNGQFSFGEIQTQRLGAGGGADSYGAGGGAGHGSGGQPGWSNNNQGGLVGSALLTKLLLGGGGGSGGIDGALDAAVRRKGGNGGGIFAIFANILLQNNVISSDGLPGQSAGGDNVAGGGCGAGGSIWVVTTNINNTGLIQSLGGDCTGSYNGGDGGYGRIRIDFIDGETGSVSPAIGYIGQVTDSSPPVLNITNNAPSVDGFTFSGSRAVSIDTSDATMRNCKITIPGPQSIPDESQRTEIVNGLLLYVNGGNPTFENVDFSNQLYDWNNVDGTGTFIYLEPDSVTFNNCQFNNLDTEVGGSATNRQGNVIYQEQGESIFNNCQFSDNDLMGATVTQQVLEGGVIYVNEGVANFYNSNFDHNTVTGTSAVIPKGGVIYSNNSLIGLYQCTLDSNSVSLNGEGTLVYSSGSQAHVDMTDVDAAGNAGTNIFNFTNGGIMSLLLSEISGNTGTVIKNQSDNLTVNIGSSLIQNNTGYGIWSNGQKTLVNGMLSGSGLGGIKGDGDISMTSFQIDDNTGKGIDGIINNFDAVNSTISYNTVRAIQATGLLNFENVEINHNGSGISGSGTLDFTNVEIKYNTGIGVNFTGNKTFETVSVRNNSAYGINSGTGSLNFSNVFINDNNGYGLNANGNMTFNNVDINNNSYYGITGNGILNFTNVDILNNGGYGISGSGNKTFQNVNITDNDNYGIDGSGTIALSSVIIRDNVGIGVNGFTGTLTATNSTISENLGGFVGSGTVAMTLESCHVDSNTTSQNGGGIRLTGSLNLTDVTVNSNSGNIGGGVYLTGDLVSNNSSFDHNHSNADGGGVYVNGTASFVESNIIENLTGQDGGGIWANGTLSLDQSSVIDNTANSEGGGIYGTGTLNIGFSELNDNSASADGGGLWWGSGQVTVERSDILHNSSNRGGGVFILAENPIFQFDVISHNDATTIGGGMYLSKSSDASSTPIIFNSTVVYNTSAVLGSGLLCTNQTNPVVQNAIFWGNLAADGVQMHLQGSSEIFVTFSDVAGGQSGIVGFDDIIFQNNIDQFPDFVSVADEDYHLMITSPCIDTGNPNAPFDPDGTIPDMGAYYFAQDGIPNIETPLSLIDFGGVPILATGEQVITISNQGLSGLIVFGVVIDPPVFSTTDSSFVLAAGQTFDVPMNFTPDGEGIFDGSITFMNNDPDEGQFTVNLHGAGDALAILDVLDVPNDEGGMVGVHWHRNVFDGIDGSDHILNYRVWREYMQGRISDDSSENEVDEDNLFPTIWTREVITDDGELRTEAWELMGTVPAQQFEEYAFTSPTLFDSTSAGIPWTTFLVSAHTADPLVFYEAVPDSGYSIDNLAPAAPDNLAGGMSGEGVVELTWSFDSPADFNYFSIYRDDLFISSTTDTSYFDASLPETSEVQYFVTATDYHENESDASTPLQVELLPLQVQQVTLNQLRWNNISFNLNLADNSIESIFSESDILVMHNDNGQYFVPSMNVHSLENIQIEKGYKIYTANQSDISVSTPGYAIDPANYPIELLPLHMNNISFLPSEPMSVELAFGGLPILMVKNSNGNYYIPNFGVNTIDPAGGLLPGSGYEVFISGMESVLFTYDPLTTLSRYTPSSELRQSYDMMIVQHYDIESTGLSQPIVITSITGNVDSGDEIAVFANGEIVGATRIVDSTSPILITAWAGFHDYDIDLPGYEPGDEIEIRLWRSSENRELKIIADLDSPYLGQSPLITGSVVVTSKDIIPQSFVLHTAYPNPFNPITTVSYDLPVDAKVTIAVYDLAGHLIAELIDENRTAGTYQTIWNAQDESSGIYLVKMVAGDYQTVQKVMLVK